jgi:putative Ca2+/H+ antiporter (TMEM165/GDT1 family)
MSAPSIQEQPQYFDALLRSFSMIIVSEIGDKTFLIAAILAMRHPRLQVFAGAFMSLVLMSILSSALGHILPTLVPKFWTQAAAGLLFLVFGGKMWVEARGMAKGQGKMLEEMKEAQEEIEEDEVNVDGGGVPLEAMEAGRLSRAREANNSKRTWAGLRNFCNFFLGPVFVQAFVLTFLGEWGDRSQIATIVLGASHASRIQKHLFPSSHNLQQNAYLVAFGTIIGHSACTALAVLGGKYVSSKISLRAGGQSFPCLFQIYQSALIIVLQSPCPHLAFSCFSVSFISMKRL